MPTQNTTWESLEIPEKREKEVSAFLGELWRRHYTTLLFVCRDGVMPPADQVKAFAAALRNYDAKKIILIEQRVRGMRKVVDLAGGTSPASVWLLENGVVDKVTLVDVNPFLADGIRKIAESRGVRGLKVVEADILNVDPDKFKDCDCAVLHGVFDKVHTVRLGGREYPYALGGEPIEEVLNTVLKLAPRMHYIDSCTQPLKRSCDLLKNLYANLVARGEFNVEGRRIAIESPYMTSIDEIYCRRKGLDS